MNTKSLNDRINLLQTTTKDISNSPITPESGTSELAAIQALLEAIQNGQEAQNQQIMQNAINGEYGNGFGTRDFFTELFNNRDNLDTSAETTSNYIAEINSNRREGVNLSNEADWHQRDRNYPTSPKGGILQPAYQPYYGELIDSWGLEKFVGTNSSGLCWDAARRCWWVAIGSEGKIIKLSEDFSQALGWWVIDNAGNTYYMHATGGFLYVTDSTYSTNGRVTKHALTDTTVGGLPSGSVISDSSAVAGTASYKNLRDITDDGTYLYVACQDNDIVGKIAISTFSSWDSSIDITGFMPTSGAIRGVAFDGTDLFVSDVTNTHITKIKTDGSMGYNKITRSNIGGLTIKDGDLYACDYNFDHAYRLAIKNTRIMEGQVIQAKGVTGAHYDIAYVADLFGAGDHGYVAAAPTLDVKVYDDDFVEVTTGTPQTTTLSDSASGLGLSGVVGICSDGTNVIITCNGSVSDGIIKFAISNLDGAYPVVAGDVKCTLGSTGIEPYGVDIHPDDSDAVIFSTENGTVIEQWDLSTGLSVQTNFELPQIFKDFPAASATIAFKNSRELYLSANQTDNLNPLVVVDFAMSRYKGDNQQPNVIKVAKKQYGRRGATFNADGDFVTWNQLDNQLVVLASDSADDEAVTGTNQRTQRFFARESSASFSSTYPDFGSISGSGRQMRRYRRKYDPSVYSSQHNVLPLDGLYIVGHAGLGIIDLESNTLFMDFKRPETASNQSMIDAHGSSTVDYHDVFIVDDIVFIASVVGTYVIDFKNDTAYLIDSGSGLFQHDHSIQDRNLITTGAAITLINPSMGGINNNNTRYVHAKQDTTIKPEYHNGNETSLDAGEIYVLLGTITGGALVKWKAGITYDWVGGSKWKGMIADDFSLFFCGVMEGNATDIRSVGDCRKIYADHATASWQSQTGFYQEFDVDTYLSNDYIFDFDVKTIWSNGVAKKYVAVCGGEIGVSDAVFIQIMDFAHGTDIETVALTTATGGYTSVVWGQDDTLYSTYNTGTAGYFYVWQRRDYRHGWTGSTQFWERAHQASTVIGDYWGPISAGYNDVTFSHNSICVTSEEGCILTEFPKQSSFYQSKDIQLEQGRQVQFLKNDSNFAFEDKILTRNIFSDVSNARFTLTNGSTNNWNGQYLNSVVFGGEDDYVNGQSGGSTQPKVEFTTEDNCTEIIIYVLRNSGCGKQDINVTNTSGDIDIVYDSYSAETVNQDLIVIKGLDAETHDVTITTRSDKNASSSNYNFIFEGCVEIVEDGTDHDADSIAYNFSPNGGTNWYTLSEAAPVAPSYVQTFTGHSSEVDFLADQDVHTPTDTDTRSLYLTVQEEQTPSVWTTLTYTDDYTVNDSASSSNRPTVVLTSPTSNDIKVTWVRHYSDTRVKAEITVGSPMKTRSYINDLGVASIK